MRLARAWKATEARWQIPDVAFRGTWGEPHKAPELQESKAKWPRFICTADEVSVMGFEIGFRTHKVCLSLWTRKHDTETEGACVLLGPHQLHALVEASSLWML